MEIGIIPISQSDNIGRFGLEEKDTKFILNFRILMGYPGGDAQQIVGRIGPKLRKRSGDTKLYSAQMQVNKIT